MPHFCSTCGRDEVICQKCGTIACSNQDCPRGMRFEWHRLSFRISGYTCEKCLIKQPPKVVSAELNRLMGIVNGHWKESTMSLGEHCRIEFRQEFGRQPTDQELKKYINRHYGHG